MLFLHGLEEEGGRDHEHRGRVKKEDGRNHEHRGRVKFTRGLLGSTPLRSEKIFAIGPVPVAVDREIAGCGPTMLVWTDKYGGFDVNKFRINSERISDSRVLVVLSSRISQIWSDRGSKY